MAYGNSCCHKGLKAYSIKATELNEKFTKARRTGTESSAVSGLVRSSCLIIDEIGRSIFDMENTRLLYSMIEVKLLRTIIVLVVLIKGRGLLPPLFSLGGLGQ